MENERLLVQFEVKNFTLQLQEGPKNYLLLRVGSVLGDTDQPDQSPWLRMPVGTARELAEALVRALLIAEGQPLPDMQTGQQLQ